MPKREALEMLNAISNQQAVRTEAVLQWTRGEKLDSEQGQFFREVWLQRKWGRERDKYQKELGVKEVILFAYLFLKWKTYVYLYV